MDQDANAAELAALEAEMAAMQARAAAIKARMERDAELERKRKSGVLAPQSPSPKKRARVEEVRPRVDASKHKNDAPDVAVKPLEAPSRFNQDLERSRNKLQANAEMRGQPRSSGFARPVKARDPAGDSPPRQRREEDLTVTENLQLGPRAFKPHTDDPTWQYYEPYSRTRLKTRAIEHEEFEGYLVDRYIISPSQLYSIVRPSRSGAEYDVPLEDDWIVIATLAEKSDIKTTAPSQLRADADDEKEEALHGRAGDGSDANAAKRQKLQPRKAKKFVSYKLVDLGGRGSSSGDAVLNLLLFEADSAVYADTGEPIEDDVTARGVRVRKESQREKREKRYIGGSYGAYERFWKESDGALVAIINPKVMRPRGAGHGFAASNIISLTPENANSIIVIGGARDLGHCQAMRRDGRACAAWCDARVNSHCDFHVQEAMRRSRSGRSELMTGTSGLQVTQGGAKTRRGIGANSVKPDYDNKTGLLPATNTAVVEGTKTWVVTGPQQPSRGNRGSGDPFASKNAAGLDTAASGPSKRSRKQKAEDEAALLARLKRDGGKTVGGQYLIASTLAPEAGKEEETNIEEKLSKPAFLARDVRKLGFNPTIKQNEVTASVEKDALRLKLDDPTGIKRTLSKKSAPMQSEGDDDLLVV